MPFFTKIFKEKIVVIQHKNYQNLFAPKLITNQIRVLWFKVSTDGPPHIFTQTCLTLLAFLHQTKHFLPVQTPLLTVTFEQHCQRATLDTCDFWEIWSLQVGLHLDRWPPISLRRLDGLFDIVCLRFASQSDSPLFLSKHFTPSAKPISIFLSKFWSTDFVWN